MRLTRIMCLFQSHNLQDMRLINHSKYIFARLEAITLLWNSHLTTPKCILARWASFKLFLLFSLVIFHIFMHIPGTQLVSEIRKELNNSQCTEGEKKRARSILAHVSVFLYPHHTQRFFFIVQTLETFSMFYMAQKRNCSEQHIYGDVNLAHILCSQHGLNKSYVYVK